ncbi:E3 ubiquitin/ISG15 ligase TRIM25-like [Leptodactylus fuscus]|uniref:E3 ubiquitin/ISG15 ligase TRIM25-like n=1 Tax=Leptodactylus fuscus TaxID=238119 RepID=UPI003F4EF127
MASVSLREELNCSICLEVYTDPVMLTCGHNYCRLCIDHLLDTQETSGIYSCPECRSEFQRRPSLQRNTKLSNIMECFSRVRPVQAIASVSCTYCINSVVPAVKTCLQCETSLCEEHLAAHNRSVDHLLIETSTMDANQKCSLHNESFKYYCPVESTCICVSCYESESHRGHHADLLAKAYEKKKKQLRHDLQKLIAVREEDARKVQSLQDHWLKVHGKAAMVTEKVMTLFLDLREKLGILEREILTDITRQEEQVSMQVSDLLQQLEDKKEGLSRTIGRLEQMCNITEVITVLQESELDVSEFVIGDKILKGLHDLDEGLISVTLHKGLSDITSGIKQEFYVPEVIDIFLDTNTAADFVFVSGDLKTASWSKVKHNRQNLPQRFKTFCQVLSTRTFSSGQHYWEVEMSQSEMCDVGASYSSVERHGEHSGIGDNEKSWSLRMYEGKFSALHNTVETSILPGSSCQRIGMYLDYEAGRLSFYELCDPIRHLHTFTTTFTEPLHVAFFLYDAWVKIRS